MYSFEVPRLGEAPLMSTYNLCFNGEIRSIIPELSPILLLNESSDISFQCCHPININKIKFANLILLIFIGYNVTTLKMCI